MGIDNAGKTSILTLMKSKFDIPAVRGLKPTLKVERSSFRFLDHNIYQNDFGGQKSYRDEYMNNKDRYLSAVDLLYYVIDTQDSLRFDESIEYFNEIIKYFEQAKMNIPIVVFFHKVDPKLAEDPTIINNMNSLREKISPFAYKFHIKEFITNIFEINTIIEAFSAGISMLYSQTEAIQRFILDIVEKMENVMALLIFEQNGIELGSYFLEHITLMMRKKILTLYEIAQRRILDQNLNTYEFSDRLDAFTKISGVIQSFEIEGWKFFILLVLEEHSEDVIIEQFNFFESMYDEMKQIMATLLVDDPDKARMLNPNGK